MSDKLTPFLDKLLAYVDKPWKVIAVVLLALTALLAWFVYTERARIADKILTDSVAPELSIPRFKQYAAILLRDTKADAVLLMQLDLGDNRVETIAGLDVQGNEWMPVKGQQLALYNESPMPLLIKLLRNEVACVDTSEDAHSEEVRAQALLGVKRICVCQVPPIIGVTVGLLLLSWRSPLGADREIKATSLIASYAMKFATW